jgi:thioredoxin reductase (NADPH)
VLRHSRGGEHEILDADHILLLTGYEQDPTLFEQLGLVLHEPVHAPDLHHATMESSQPGVFVCGTAIAGTQQRARVFIENSHVHVERIARAITGRDVPWSCTDEYAALEES